ncbi:hypothetical protein C6502_15560 [Candidatus Poribacteria bacterium]|nr:MAG: hypothetical protein C6502_15560 [Candidatus Poribacteria bacterium]
MMSLRIEDALSTLLFQNGMPIDLSPDGKWVAYTLKDPRRGEKIDDERYSFFTRSGVRIFGMGCDIWVTNTTSGQSKCLTGGKGSSWGPVWSPDGNYLIFYSDRDGQARLWMWEKATDTLRQVSDITVRPYFGDEVVRWTPDSRKVLCKVVPEGMTLEDTLDLIVGAPTAADDGERDSRSSTLIYRSRIVSEQDHCTEEPQENTVDVDADVTNVYLADLALIDVFNGNVERIVCRHKVTGYWLSPDATKVAFTVLTENAYDIAVASLSDCCPRVIASDVQNEHKFSVSWSPKGDLLSYTSAGDCFIASVRGDAPQNLTSTSHPSFGNTYRAPLWDTSGQNLYLLASDTLWRISIADSSVNAVTQIPDRRLMEVVSPASGGRFWSPEGGKLLYLITRIDKTKKIEFYKVNLSTGKFNRLMEADANCGSPAILTIDVSDDNQRVIYTRQDVQRCEDIWIADVDFQNPRQLTHVNPVDDTVVMGTGRLINWRSLDGEELCGALLLPTNYEPGKQYPLVVWVYGGDRGGNRVNQFGLVGPGINNLQLLATRGYAVLFPDAPLQKGTPMQDLAKTVLPGVDRAVEMGIADPERLGVMGHSYGGYCTLGLIAQTTRFKAAVVSGGTGNLISAYGAMRRDGSTYSLPWAETGQGRMGGTPWEMRDRYIENSPAFYLDRIQTPLLLLHGELDNAAPSFLADEIFVGLRRLGKWVMYAKYEGESHAPVDWEYANQIDYWNRIITMFDTFLKPSKRNG